MDTIMVLKFGGSSVADMTKEIELLLSFLLKEKQQIN